MFQACWCVQWSVESDPSNAEHVAMVCAACNSGIVASGAGRAGGGAGGGLGGCAEYHRQSVPGKVAVRPAVSRAAPNYGGAAREAAPNRGGAAPTDGSRPGLDPLTIRSSFLTSPPATQKGALNGCTLRG